MSEMVERVAEAIYDSVQQWGAFQSKIPEIQEDYRKMARAAIEAMRIPTEAMSMVDRDPEDSTRIWVMMIDAALKP